MFQIWKLLFPKLFFGLDDLNGGSGAPDPGQPDPEPSGNDPDPNPDPAAAAPTDFIEVKGVKIPASEFEALAKEKYKDRFEAFDNREKWQAENTRKAQENAQIQRDAEAYRRMMADPRFNQQAQPRNEYESLKEDYIREHSEFYPDADPQKLRSFLAKQFDWSAKLAGFKAQETVRPLQDQQAMDFEEKFLAAHPKVQRGTPQYEEIRDLVGAGVNPEKAYQVVFHDDILKEREAEAIKRRDEEAKRKLQQSRQNSTQGEKLPGKTRSERIWAAIEKHGG